MDEGHTRSAWPLHSYENIYYRQECYESVEMSRQRVAQTRAIPPLMHKGNLRMSGGAAGIQPSACCALTRRDAPRKASERVCRLLACRPQHLKAESTLEKNLDKLLEGVLS